MKAALTMFGYNEGGQRHWINLDHVAKVDYSSPKKTATVFFARPFGPGTVHNVSLAGEAADKLREAMGFLEASGSHVD